MITGINHLTIAVKDLERSFRFYQDVLGFTPLMRHHRGAYFLAGETWFCLDLDPTTRQGALPEYTHFAFGVSQTDFHNVAKKIRSSGVDIWKDNKSEGDSLYFLDPDGHKLELHVGDWRSRIRSAKANAWNTSLQFFGNDTVVKRVEPTDREWVASLKDQYFNGADFIVTRGRKVYPIDLPGFYAENHNGKRVGFLGYDVRDDSCEVITLDASAKFLGIGTALMDALLTEARSKNWNRIWLITTNDNLDALRFYQKRGFSILKANVNAIELSRKLKPSIPLVGNYGIPIRDEIEMEMRFR